jgi:hypothetical protein
VGIAQVRFTENASVIDVSCPQCGHYLIEIPGYHLDLNALSGDQRAKLIAFVNRERSGGEKSPLITRDRLHELTGAGAPKEG